MPTRKQDDKNNADFEPEFVEHIPVTGTRSTDWTARLLPLLDHPGRPAKIGVYEDPKRSYDAQSNLSSRRVRIPRPDDDWSFMARGCELFAIYHGRIPPHIKGTKKPNPQRRKTGASVRRTQRAR